jgi:putative transcriptional regulator
MIKRKFKSDAFEAIYTSAIALLEIGVIDKATMRRFDDACVPQRQGSQIPLLSQQSRFRDP